MAGALIGALRVSLSAETSAFEAGMKRSQRTAKTTAQSIEGSFKGIGNSLKAGIAGFISSVSAGAILAAGKAALDYAGSLGEVAQQLGVTTRELQTFRFAAQQMGASQAEADQALGKLSVSMSKALSGSKQAAAAFSAVGVSLVDLQTKSKTDIIGQIADGMNKAGGASQNAAAGVAIFGRGFQKIGALMNQGSRGLNALALAAEELGIVLSDEQIQKADETADKLDAMQTVLKARIAGVVADNADSILQFADALGELTRFIGNVVGALARLNQAIANIPQPPAWLQGFIGGPATMAIEFLKNITNEATKPRLGRSATVKLGAAKPFVPPVSGSPKQFLAGGGGSGKGRKAGRDRSAEEAQRKLLDNMRAQNQFDQDILSSKRQILQSQRSLARNADDRANIDLEILAAERREFEAQMAYEVKIFEITKGAEGISQAWADQKRELYTINEGLQRQAIEREQDEENRRAVARLVDVDFDLQREKLDLEAGLAETASEQRDVQLRLLDLWYRQERAKLDAIMAEEEIGSVAWEEARKRRAALDTNQVALRDNIIAGTRGPMEDYLASLPTTAAKAQEALERLQVQGMEGLIDSALALSEGLDSAKDALLQTLKDFLLGLARMELQKGVGSLFGQSGNIGGFLGSLFGGSSSDGIKTIALDAFGTGNNVPNFASGGGFNVLGKTGVDNNLLSLNGLPIAKVSYGERISVSNDNTTGRQGMGSRGDVNVNVYGVTDANSFHRSETQIARAARRRLGV